MEDFNPYSKRWVNCTIQWIDQMNFDIVDDIGKIETIVKGSGIREIERLRKIYGHGNWKKMKGIARVRHGKIKGNLHKICGLHQQ